MKIIVMNVQTMNKYDLMDGYPVLHNSQVIIQSENLNKAAKTPHAANP